MDPPPDSHASESAAHDDNSDRRVAPHVALIRIGAVIAMSFSAAFGIFLIIGGWWLAGIGLIALAVPFFFAMRFAEGRPTAQEGRERTTS